MTRPAAIAGLLSAALVTTTPLCSQEPQQEPPPQPEPESPPLDPVRQAAEILRKRLGLKPGPGGKQPKATEAPAQKSGAPAEQNATPQQPQGQGVETEPQQKPPVDPTEQAARAIEKLLPKASPPEAAPMPNAHGTPEPIAPQAPPVEPSRLLATRAGTARHAGLPWSGRLSTRYRVRHGGGATDQDLVVRLQADVGRRGRDPVSFHLRGRGFVNADGERRDDPFPGLDHSFGDDVNLRLYGAHFDLSRVPGTSLVRLGRQDLDETPTVLSFDGARIDSRRLRGATQAWFSAYIGQPVHHFEASSSGDLVAGIGGDFTPWHNCRVRIDYMHLRDEFLALDRQDDLLGVRWWQRIGDELRLSGRHTWRDGEPRDLRLTANKDLGGTDVYISLRELQSTQRAQVTELDPFFVVASEYRPYRQFELTLTRELLGSITASAGVDLRRLRNDDDEGTFNREFDHYRADITWDNAFVEHLSVTLAGNVWDSSGEFTRAVTGDVTFRPDRTLRIALGAGYDLFRYDVYAGYERLDVRSYYLRIDRRLANGLRIDGAYELQQDNIDEFHLFRLGMTWTF